MAGGASSDRDERASAVDDGDRSDLRAILGGYAELVRLPNLFTAPPDVILGAALAALAGGTPLPTRVGGLALGSVLLYAGGTTLNDAFDAPVDARERPERPIPSGRVARRTAFGLGFALLLVAVAVAFAVAGGPAGVAAGLVAVAIVAYDGFLKGSAAGFLAMGITRGLNVVLGTTAVGAVVLESPRRLLAVPAVVTAYIAAVTFMAARETEGGNRRAVAVASAGAVAAVLALGWFLAGVEPAALEAAVALAFAGAFCWWVGRPLRAAFADPVPSTVGPAVGACVLGLVLLDAAFAAAVGVRWGLAAGLALVPAVGLSRAFDVT
ncbi:UbiA family prenyltransferase [Natrinema salsiterrestre]|uniref:UbiA family prenyltransferase n=1 Tax=Natrinema salsiterrestre TaxID=2950540 RepID=A0A9Q4L374_9EURY|nr:UbiA family prenyltransferase [Natrinema salsiterrestre]MDF9746767.1 UbiA family prenyltransferase [Natrinema salsiterrestre]